MFSADRSANLKIEPFNLLPSPPVPLTHPAMSPAEQNLNSDRANSDQSIETIYTTVEVQRDRTDWLTVVSNLRQINRQLVEEIARLEQALASAKQSLHTHKEENQSHEITILQQQDDLRIAHDRVSGLFHQLETSHQIGQRQQTLIETLSQQLEIVRSIVPQIEAEHEELRQKYQQQSQKLTKTEQVAIELHRRLKLQPTPVAPENPATTATTPAFELTPATGDFGPTDTIDRTLTLPIIDRSAPDIDSADRPPTPDLSTLKPSISDSTISIAEIDPAPPLAPLQIDRPEISSRTSSAPTLLEKTTILSPSRPSSPSGWREAIRQGNGSANVDRHRYNPILDPVAGSTLPAPETIDKESTAVSDLTTKSAPNWPAPTVNRDSKTDRSIAKTGKIDLPKFPKKVDS